MIGTAAAIFLLGNGRIMGASGIIGGLVDRSGLSNWQERAAFLAALVVVPALMLPLYNVEVKTNITDNLALVVAAGLWSALARVWRMAARRATGCAGFRASRCGAWYRPCSICWQAVSRWFCSGMFWG